MLSCEGGGVGGGDRGERDTTERDATRHAATAAGNRGRTECCRPAEPTGMSDSCGQKVTGRQLVS